jgi:glycosyltransferase involved in cell wall biosynthesis
MPKVSVITPTYNRADMLGQAIQSVLDQDFTDWELIIVDDGSRDNTREVVAGFADPRIRYIYQENKGLPAARNTGIRNAQGQYIAFLDSDDLFLSHKLAEEVAILDGRPDLGLVACGHFEVDRNLRVLREMRPWQSHPQLNLTTWLLTCPLVVSTVLVRREWLERVGLFDEQMRYVEDWDLWLRLSYAGCRMGWLQRPVCCYRIHGSTMTRNVQLMKAGMLAMFDKFYAQPDLPTEVLALRDASYGMAYLAGAAREYGTGQSQAASQSLERAIALLPDLIEGEYPFLASALVAWAVNPVTGDPATFLERVLENLPASALRLRSLRQRMMCEAGIQSAVDANMVRNDALARRYLLSALEKEKALRDEPALVITLLVDHARAQERERQMECIERFFNNLPPELANLRAFRRKALGRLYMAQGFEAHASGAPREAASALWQGVRLDPEWARNRGVWSILLRSLFGFSHS